MTATEPFTAADQEQLQRIQDGLRKVTIPFPHFAGLVRAVRVALDERVPTMGVFASGRMVANPAFARSLKENELIFVLAHELFHLALRTHDRAVGSDHLRFNIAHDYIINDILRVELGFQQVPAGGLDRPGARHQSAEEIMLEMAQDPRPPSGTVWRPVPGGAGGVPGRAIPQGDVLDGDLEGSLFPDESAADRQAQTDTLREAAGKALSLAQVMDAVKRRRRDAGSAQQQVTALRGLYRTPWELALQRWLESVAPGERTFVRPSRRGADRNDLVLPGRKRESWILHVVLDTSGSMADELPKALGAIADFCEAVAVEQLRLLQCDTTVTSDELLPPSEVERHEIKGLGGSDLSPALRYLAQEPEVEAVVVLTDGEIDYPQEEMPYQVLWVLPARVGLFRPPYGVVITMQAS